MEEVWAKANNRRFWLSYFHPFFCCCSLLRWFPIYSTSEMDCFRNGKHIWRSRLDLLRPEERNNKQNVSWSEWCIQNILIEWMRRFNSSHFNCVLFSNSIREWGHYMCSTMMMVFLVLDSLVFCCVRFTTIDGSSARAIGSSLIIISLFVGKWCEHVNHYRSWVEGSCSDFDCIFESPVSRCLRRQQHKIQNNIEIVCDDDDLWTTSELSNRCSGKSESVQLKYHQKVIGCDAVISIDRVRDRRWICLISDFWLEFHLASQ